MAPAENIITQEQVGFQQHLSTEDKVTYIAQKIKHSFQDTEHTLTVWTDMEKAYDKVWKDGLCHAVTLQWIPSHCNVPGIEAADSLVKEGTTKEQVDSLPATQR